MRKLSLVLRGRNGPEELRLEGEGESWRLFRGSGVEEVSLAHLPGGRISVLLPDGRQISGRARERSPGHVEVVASGRSSEVLLADPLHDRLAHAPAGETAGGEEEVRALMPGRVVQVAVSPGERVESGALLLVLEAMKMQNEIRAPRAATVVRCDARPGTAVDGGALLIVLSAAPKN